MHPRLLVLPLALAALVGCVDDAPDRAADPPARPVVEIRRSRFVPEELTVAAGTTVVFVNLDPYAHTVTSSDGSSSAFDSGELARGETFELTLSESGTFPYFCRIHPTMRASVVAP